ncbi:GAF domain-containing protein [Porticoccaceae bacterium]|jgi:GAF domain-containing protein|nr:GAF domain-containing protein [Porticoccaceae bacterium]MDA8885823.1 GAF domain-containing protein [Porticoccaceae bacterium]MDA8902394.1 GAF domain-containing protein [Porticoccaceae bacterium]MDA8920201.1 GAF domain-containing protein [Porticoccaceae bacterium]MDA8935694.1 GAF domain-containing protein [Porticoccaceae bacterium]
MQQPSDRSVSSRLKAFADSKPGTPSKSTETDYGLISKQLAGLIDGESDRIANLANCSALLWQELSGINWVGFYLLKRNRLILGPFQGKPACTRINMGSGVCGTAATMGKTVIVADVHQFPGHIACDAASKSEIVVPMIKDGQLIGVLDIDSPSVDRFDHLDQQGLENLLQVLIPQL